MGGRTPYSSMFIGFSIFNKPSSDFSGFAAHGSGFPHYFKPININRVLTVGQAFWGSPMTVVHPPWAPWVNLPSTLRRPKCSTKELNDSSEERRRPGLKHDAGLSKKMLDLSRKNMEEWGYSGYIINSISIICLLCVYIYMYVYTLITYNTYHIYTYIRT